MIFNAIFKLTIELKFQANQRAIIRLIEGPFRLINVPVYMYWANWSYSNMLTRVLFRFTGVSFNQTRASTILEVNFIY